MKIGQRSDVCGHVCPDNINTLKASLLGHLHRQGTVLRQPDLRHLHKHLTGGAAADSSRIIEFEEMKLQDGEQKEAVKTISTDWTF